MAFLVNACLLRAQSSTDKKSVEQFKDAVGV